jgi:cell division septum initiation protein DivIVA
MDPQTSSLNRSLSITFPGYSREAVDDILHDVEQAYRELLREHDALKSVAETLEAKVRELSSELDARRKRERAVADALITAHEEANRVLTAAHERGEKESSDLLDAAHREAEGLARELVERQRETETLVDDTMNRLRTFLRNLHAHAATEPTTESASRRDEAQQPDLRLAGS